MERRADAFNELAEERRRQPEKQNGDGKRPGRARERDAHLCHHRLRQYAPGIDAADGRMNAYSGKGNADSVSLH